MPVVFVKMFEGRTMDQKRQIVKGITKVILDTIKVDKTAVRVIIEEYSRDHWAIAGEFVADKEKRERKTK